MVSDVQHKESRDRKLKPEAMFRMVEVIVVLVLASLWPVIYYYYHYYYYLCQGGYPFVFVYVSNSSITKKFRQILVNILDGGKCD